MIKNKVDSLSNSIYDERVMGLDMYLLEAPKNSEEQPKFEVEYWRKFNALHGWFVTHVQIGIDDCGCYEVTKDNLEDLVSTMEKVVETKNPNLFPPTDGFFFGSTVVSDYYFEACEWGLLRLKSILESFDWENKKLFYTSSW